MTGERHYLVTGLPMDCGAAAVAAVCRFHGIDVTLADARRAVGSDEAGTTLNGIVRGAQALGLEARAVKAPGRRSKALPLPAIVHVDDDHWMVLYEVAPHDVELSDPSHGPLRLSRREFEARWSGYAALFGQRATVTMR